MGLELLEHLEKSRPGTDLARALAGLRADVDEDRKELEALMARLGVERSVSRRALAWLGEKAAQLKLALDDRGAGSLHLFESLEAMSLGIEGKRSLWRALASASEGSPALRGPDYGRLEQRAWDQRQRIESLRLEAAKTALAGGDRE